MFGHVKANREDLSESAYLRYRAVYCGLCHTLRERFGAGSRMLLTFDLTYLAVLLSALYEPEERSLAARCCVHPIKRQAYIQNAAVDYAADMTVMLAYLKCLDNWHDDGSVVSLAEAAALKKAYKSLAEKYPRQHPGRTVCKSR